MDSNMALSPCSRAIAAAKAFERNMAALTHRQPQAISLNGIQRLLPTAKEIDRLSLPETQRGTVLYLAYGSNLSVEKFRQDRGIAPLAQINVQVPSLRLTFDLPGIPYTEPCFANSGIRDPEKDVPLYSSSQEKDDGHHKDNWHKGLIGVVYEVTPTDYAHIIATEGGGAGYQDILVDCHAFTTNPKESVPQMPTSTPFKAHTLFAPRLPEGSELPKDGGRTGRPDPSYAQPSARYLKLITDGAAELELPYEYQDYLHSIRPFRITTARQQAGRALLLSTWMPIVKLVFALGRAFADKNGLLPAWLRSLTALVFTSVWISYDAFFKPVFGEGERSIPDGGQPDLLSKSSYEYEKSIRLAEPPVLKETVLEKAAQQSFI